MAFITNATYPQIRAVLGTFIDTNILPDSTIALDIYAGRTDDWIEDTDPNYATRTGTALLRLTRAAILYCASLLCPIMPALTGENFGDYQYSSQAVDWEARAQSLLSEANEEITDVTNPTGTAIGRPTMFAVASGTRGR